MLILGLIHRGTCENLVLGGISILSLSSSKQEKLISYDILGFDNLPNFIEETDRNHIRSISLGLL